MLQALVSFNVNTRIRYMLQAFLVAHFNVELTIRKTVQASQAQATMALEVQTQHLMNVRVLQPVQQPTPQNFTQTN